MTHGEFRMVVADTPAVLAYMSTPNCGVCGVLRPKVEALLSERFPKIVFRYIDVEAEPDVAAQESVFVVPTILVYFAGREHLRLARHFGIDELAEEIARPYTLMFS